MRYIKIFELYNKEEKADLLAKQLNIIDDKYQWLKNYLKVNKGIKYLELFTFFSKKVELNNLKYLYEDMFKYSNLIKEKNIKPLDYLDLNKDPYKQYEKLSDIIFKEIQNSNKRKFALSFISNKYKHLLNDDIIELLYKLKDKNNRDELQGKIFNKLALIKTSDELLVKIKEIININPHWNKEFIIKTTKEGYGNILYDIDNTLLVDINENYDLLCKLVCYDKDIRKHNWCIVRSDGTFKSYINDYKKILIYFDFNLNENDNKSYIGMQVLPVSNDILSAYDAYDEKFDILEYKPVLKKYIKGYDEDSVVKMHKENNITIYFAVEIGLIKYLKYYLHELASPSELEDKANFIVKQAAFAGKYDILKLLISNKYILNGLDTLKIKNILINIKDRIVEENVFLYNKIGDILLPLLDIKVGDLVFIKSDRCFGLVVSDFKYEDGYYVSDVCYRNQGGEVISTTLDDCDIVKINVIETLIDNHHISAYKSIAKDHNVTINPKYEQWEEEYFNESY